MTARRDWYGTEVHPAGAPSGAVLEQHAAACWPTLLCRAVDRAKSGSAHTYSGLNTGCVTLKDYHASISVGPVLGRTYLGHVAARAALSPRR